MGTAFASFLLVSPPYYITDACRAHFAAWWSHILGVCPECKVTSGCDFVLPFFPWVHGREEWCSSVLHSLTHPHLSPGEAASLLCEQPWPAALEGFEHGIIPSRMWHCHRGSGLPAGSVASQKAARILFQIWSQTWNRVLEIPLTTPQGWWGKNEDCHSKAVRPLLALVWCLKGKVCSPQLTRVPANVGVNNYYFPSSNGPSSAFTQQ